MVDKLKISFDPLNGKDLASKLVEACDKKRGIFAKSDLIPEVKHSQGLDVGSLTHALYVFYGAAFDSMRQSGFVYASARKLALAGALESFPVIDEEEIKHIFSYSFDNGISNPAHIAKRCAEKLKDYHNDPRILFDAMKDSAGTVEFDYARRLLKKFYGFGNGKTSILIKNLVRFGYIQLKNPFDAIVKIDRHMIRMSIGNGVVNIEPEEASNKTMPFDSSKPVQIHVSNFVLGLEKVYRAVCSNGNAIDPIALCDAKWVVGSMLCARKDSAVCTAACPLDCKTLVGANKSGTYVIYPTDTRDTYKGSLLGFS